jgi:prepilin-type N-terminal cleavage/methylation domain-containing protein
MVQPHQRRAFTLVELLVVVLVLGMLMALLVTAVQSARETARRTQCLHKLSELGSGMQQFESANLQYPGWQHHPFPAIDAETAKPFTYSTSWFAQLLPYIGYAYLHDRTIPFTWKRPLRRGRDTYSYAPSLHTVAVCPSDVEKMQTKGAWMSYAVNCGRKDAAPTSIPPPQGVQAVPADWRANGMFHDLLDWRGNPNLRVTTVKMDSSFIRSGDGLETTLMLSENLDAKQYFDRNETNNGFIFDWPVSSGFQAINGPGFSGEYITDSNLKYATARPSSNHRGGVNAAFAAGNARFLNEHMDYLVYVALMTPKGSEAREPGSMTYSDDAIRQQKKLSEDQF